MIQAGELRDVVTIQLPVEVQDSAGQPDTAYETLHENVRARVTPLSGREFVAAQQVQAGVTTRIKIRRYPGVVSSCRVLRVTQDGDPDVEITEVYDILAVLPDPESGQQYLTLMCEQRFAEGWRRGG